MAREQFEERGAFRSEKGKRWKRVMELRRHDRNLPFLGPVPTDWTRRVETLRSSRNNFTASHVKFDEVGSRPSGRRGKERRDERTRDERRENDARTEERTERSRSETYREGEKETSTRRKRTQENERATKER